jgi:hypothetical protein
LHFLRAPTNSFRLFETAEPLDALASRVMLPSCKPRKSKITAVSNNSPAGEVPADNRSLWLEMNDREQCGFRSANAVYREWIVLAARLASN